MTDTQPLSPLLNQMILAKLGLFCSERLSNDIYFLNEAIDLLIPTFDLEDIKGKYDKAFGEGKWDYIMKKKKKLDLRLASSKTFYDAISDKSLVKKTTIIKDDLELRIQNIFKKFFFNTSSRIRLIQLDIYMLAVFLIQNSSVQRSQIKLEYFKNLEQRENRKISMDTRRQPMGDILYGG